MRTVLAFEGPKGLTTPMLGTDLVMGAAGAEAALSMAAPLRPLLRAW